MYPPGEEDSPTTCTYWKKECKDDSRRTHLKTQKTNRNFTAATPVHPFTDEEEKDLKNNFTKMKEPLK